MSRHTNERGSIQHANSDAQFYVSERLSVPPDALIIFPSVKKKNVYRIFLLSIPIHYFLWKAMFL